MNLLTKALSAASISIFSLTINALSLPSGMVSLYSPEGHQYLSESDYKKPFEPLSRTFITEYNDYCAVASSVMVLNALDHTSDFTQDNFFTRPVRQILTPTQVRFGRASIVSLSHIFHLYHRNASYIYAKDLTLEQFRQVLKSQLSQNNHYLIAQYSRIALRQRGVGHITPIAAYDEKSDRVLVDDVASFHYPPTWIKSANLLAAMQYGSGYRGLLLVS